MIYAIDRKDIGIFYKFYWEYHSSFYKLGQRWYQPIHYSCHMSRSLTASTHLIKLSSAVIWPLRRPMPNNNYYYCVIIINVIYKKLADYCKYLRFRYNNSRWILTSERNHNNRWYNCMCLRFCMWVINLLTTNLNILSISRHVTQFSWYRLISMFGR